MRLRIIRALSRAIDRAIRALGAVDRVLERAWFRALPEEDRQAVRDYPEG